MRINRGGRQAYNKTKVFSAFCFQIFFSNIKEQ